MTSSCSIVPAGSRRWRACRQILDDLKITTYGNGHPGLKTRVQALEVVATERDKRWSHWGTVAVATIGSIITVLGAKLLAAWH